MEWSEFSRENLEAATSPAIFRRGVEYFRGGHLVKACRIDNQISGLITGAGGDYKVRLWLEGAQLKGDCSCPYPEFCKHMIALGMAWLEERTAFLDLEPKLSTILGNPVAQRNILVDLIHKDPLNFLKLFPDLYENSFISSRGIANLIRNIFDLPQITITHAEALWEKIHRVQQLVYQKIQSGDPLAIPLWLELLSGYEKAFTSYPNEELIQLWKDEIHSILSFLNACKQSELERIYEKTWSFYIDPNLWELSINLRGLLWNLHPYCPDFLFNRMDECFARELSLLVLISLYTLLAEAPFEDFRLQNCLNIIVSRLTETAEGSLWLVDSLIESNLDQAYQLARRILHRFPGEEPHFRERLITIHQKRSEFKQAASLSFIQFRENRSFEEYCRLKVLLANSSGDWMFYSKKIREFLKDSTDQLLVLQILMEEGETQEISNHLPLIFEEEKLFSYITGMLRSRIQKSFIPFYPCFIKQLLLRESSNDWKTALELMVILKRHCLNQDTERYRWIQLKKELEQIYQNDAKFSKKFAMILADLN